MITMDETAVRDVLKHLYAAWTDGDADAFAANFTEDTTSILPGSYRKGRAQIRDNMAAGFAGPLKGSWVRDEVRDVRFLDDTTAVLVSRSGVVAAGQTEPERWVLATWVLTRQDDGWLIAAYHNCPA